MSVSTFTARLSCAATRTIVALALATGAGMPSTPAAWAGPAASGGNLKPDQVHDTPLMSITRELTQDGPACGTSLTCGADTTSDAINIGQTSGPSLTGQVTKLPPAPDTSAQPPAGTAQVNTGSKIPTTGKVIACADGWVDSMGRPFFGNVFNGLITWTGGPFIPSESSFDSSPIQTGTLPADPGIYAGTFPWVGGSYALNTSVNSTAISSTSGTMQAGVEINPGQTIAYLSAGPNGNCGQLLQACQADSGSAMVDPNTLSTDFTQIGGVNCVNYFGNCEVSKLLNASKATPFVTNSADPEGVTGGYCQTFNTPPACNDLLALYQTSAPNFNCACTAADQAPFCQVKCPSIVQAWQVDVGPLAVCSCVSPSGAPSCQPDCLGQLGSAQAAAGDTHTCSCAPNSSTSAPTCPLNCKGLLPQFQAQNPNYACSCPTGTAVVANPVCQPTCKALAINKQGSLGSNYTCSCQDPTSTTEQPSCPMNCGGMLATQSQYQTNANQICACPNGNSAVATPVCQPTCAAQLAATTCPAGQIAFCPNGDSSPGTPTCQQQSCGSLLANWTCPTGAAATCPSGNSALSNPQCAQTCGSQLATASCPLGQTPTCASGASAIGAPTCVQQTCGTLRPIWACTSPATAQCPNGTGALSNPTCSQPLCSQQPITCQTNYVAYCSSTYATPYCIPNCIAMLASAPYAGKPYYCSFNAGVLPAPVTNGMPFNSTGLASSPCTVPGTRVSTSDPICGQATQLQCVPFYQGNGSWSQWEFVASNWYNGYPISGSSCLAQNWWSYYFNLASNMGITNLRYGSGGQLCTYTASYSSYPNWAVFPMSGGSGCP